MRSAFSRPHFFIVKRLKRLFLVVTNICMRTYNLISAGTGAQAQRTARRGGKPLPFYYIKKGQIHKCAVIVVHTVSLPARAGVQTTTIVAADATEIAAGRGF